MLVFRVIGPDFCVIVIMCIIKEQRFFSLNDWIEYVCLPECVTLLTRLLL